MLSFPKEHRFEVALVALRIMECIDVSPHAEDLQNAFDAGLIDRETVFFFGREEPAEDGEYYDQHYEGNEAKEWCNTHGLRVEWSDGDLLEKWREGRMEGKGSDDFVSWADEVAEKRIAERQRIVAARKT